MKLFAEATLSLRDASRPSRARELKLDVRQKAYNENVAPLAGA